MYLQVWHHWACWCHLHSAIPAEAPLSLILDYLHASDLFKKKKNLEPSRTRMSTHIKALRYISLKLDLPILAYLQSQTVSDFLKSKTRIPLERSEATPIPLAVLAAWENRIIAQDAKPAEIVTLGCFLIATMASLRFRDLLRTKPTSISLQGHILRGISWRTKTSFRPTMGSLLLRNIYKTIQWTLDFQVLTNPRGWHHPKSDLLGYRLGT